MKYDYKINYENNKYDYKKYNNKLNINKEIEKINIYEKNIYLKEKQFTTFTDLLAAVRRLQRIPAENEELEKKTEIQPTNVNRDLFDQVEQKLKQALYSINGNVGGGRTYLSYQTDKKNFAQNANGNILSGVPGVFYKFDRGVVLIDGNGTRKEEILDGTFHHHVDATVRQASLLNVSVSDEAPYNAGVDATEQGLVVMQFEGDNGIIYLPPNLTLEQIDIIIDEIVPRTMFNFNIYQNQQIFDDDYNTLTLLQLLDDCLKKMNDSQLSPKKTA